MYTEIFQQILIGFALIILCAVTDSASANLDLQKQLRLNQEPASYAVTIN